MAKKHSWLQRDQVDKSLKFKQTPSNHTLKMMILKQPSGAKTPSAWSGQKEKKIQESSKVNDELQGLTKVKMQTVLVVAKA